MAAHMSLFFVGFLFAIGLIVLVYGQSSDTSTCTITATSCPCAQMPASGTCVKHEGDNMCSTEACKPSYRCDCLGYEMCKRSLCTLYAGDNEVVPNTAGLFPCHIIPIKSDAVCTSFDHVMDTVEAVENMYTTVVSANDEASAVMMEAYEIVAAIESDIVAVNDALKSIETSKYQVTKDEKDEIEKQAEEVISSVADSGQLALLANHEARKVYQGSRDVAELRNEIRNAEDNIKTLKQTLDEAQKRAKENSEECTQCSVIQAEVDNIEKARKEAVLKAAEIAKNSREQNRKAGEYRDKVQENRSRAGDIKQKLLSKIQEIKNRAINVDI